MHPDDPDWIDPAALRRRMGAEPDAGVRSSRPRLRRPSGGVRIAPGLTGVTITDCRVVPPHQA